ncbi:MAG: hypothetical protein EXS16_21840, partial [Gemmataceae bacterium]|nr:hypothetical protein [Gemmataceae bacterium]
MLERGLAAAQSRLQSFGKGVAMVGAGIGAAGAAITAPFMASMGIFTGWGAEMREGMRETGIGFEQLDYLMDSLHVGMDALIPATAKVSEFLVAAAGGSVSATAALGELGLTVNELSSMSQGDRLQTIAERIGDIADASRRISLQRDFFGKHGLALDVQGGAEGMQQRSARRDYVEGTPGQGDMQLAASTERLFKEMLDAIKSVWREIGATAAPAMKEFYTYIIDAAVVVRNFVTENRELLGVMFRIGGILLGVGSAVGVLGGAIYGAAYAFAFLSGAISIVGGVLNFLWGIVAFGGWAILTAATYAWGAATAIASGIATAAIWTFWAAQSVVFTSALATMVLYDAAVWIWGATVAIASGIASAAIWLHANASSIAMIGVTGFFIAVSAASVAWSMITVAASAVATAAMWAYSLAMGIGSVVSFALFLALAVATIAWGFITAVASAVASAAMWVYNAALAAATAVAAFFSVTQGLGAVATLAMGAASIAASVGALILKVATWLLAAAVTVATGGINLLIAALVALVIAFAAVVVAFLVVTPLVTFGLMAYAIFMGIIKVVGDMGATVGSAFGQIWTTLASTGARIAAGFSTLMSGLVSTATSAWGGIMDAFAVNDMELLWEIIKATAILAWAQ